FGPDFPLEAYVAEVMARADAEREGVGVPLKIGAVELLDLLDAACIPRAIATSSSHRTVALTLRSSGIWPRFDAVIAAGDYARGKPNPDPFLAAAERLGVAPESCLALEDSHNGVRAASAAGMMTVMAPDLLPPTDEMRRLCHAVVESLHDVCAMIEAEGAARL
ncbi:MAG: HAD family hydrolase, partial [Caulobacteraceae bacterium]